MERIVRGDMEEEVLEKYGVEEPKKSANKGRGELKGTIFPRQGAVKPR